MKENIDYNDDVNEHDEYLIEDNTCKCFIREEKTGKKIRILNDKITKIGRKDVSCNDKGISREHLSLCFHLDRDGSHSRLKLIGLGKQPVRILKPKEGGGLDLLHQDTEISDAVFDGNNHDNTLVLRNSKPIHLKNGSQFYIGLRNNIFTVIIEDHRTSKSYKKYLFLFILLISALYYFNINNNNNNNENLLDKSNLIQNWHYIKLKEYFYFVNQFKFKITTQISQNSMSYLKPRPVNILISTSIANKPRLEWTIKDFYLALNKNDITYKYLLEFEIDNEILKNKSKTVQISNQILEMASRYPTPIFIIHYYCDNGNDIKVSSYVSFLEKLLDGSHPILSNSILLIQTNIAEKEITELLNRDNEKEDQYLDLKLNEIISSKSKIFFDDRLVHRIRDTIVFF